MLKFFEFIISFICFTALSCIWVFLASNITYYIKKYFNFKIHKSNILEYSITIGFILEICLSLLYILVCPKEYHLSKVRIINIIQRGGSYASIFTPLTSIVGSVIGIKSGMPPWKFFDIMFK